MIKHKYTIGDNVLLPDNVSGNVLSYSIWLDTEGTTIAIYEIWRHDNHLVQCEPESALRPSGSRR